MKLTKKAKTKSNGKVVKSAFVAKTQIARNAQYFVPKPSPAAIENAIVQAYRKIPLPVFKLRPPVSLTRGEVALTLMARGLGDVVVLTGFAAMMVNHPVKIEICPSSPYFDQVFKFCPAYSTYNLNHTFLIDGPKMYTEYNCGNGHVIQRYCRAFGLPVPLVPKGCLGVPNVPKRPNRVLLHFDANPVNIAVHKAFHPHPKAFYASNQVILERFIANHPELEFIEVGLKPLNIAGATYFSTPTIGHLIQLAQSCSWFIGVDSGPMHVATATGCRGIIINTLPAAEKTVLPVLRPSGGFAEEWLYPQHVHLHQEGETLLVPRFSQYSLEAAFAGDVYPFWSDRWLSMIFNPEFDNFHD